MKPARASTRVLKSTAHQDLYALADSALQLQDMTAFLASQGLEEAARSCSAALGAIRAKLAADTAA